eukprot:1916681-Ditylum_brightwellii.AAC.1
MDEAIDNMLEVLKEGIENRRKFVVPDISMERLKANKFPDIFVVYTDFKDVIIDFIDNNIGDISVDIGHDYMNK